MARIKSLPAPTGGWNARDALSDMPKEDAVRLDNYWPDLGKVILRKGYEEWATGLGGNVEMLAEFHDGATQKFIAGANGTIWDISTTGTASSISSGYSSNQWQWSNFNGSMGLVNGVDAPLVYDGSSISAMTVSGSGLTATTLVGITVYKSRTYFWANSSQDFWYSAVNALGGTLTRFPLNRVSQFGGRLVTVDTWTVDDGAGADDLIVFVMSSGDVIVYSGSDPGSDFALQGVYKAAEPLSIRSTVKYGADLIIATTEGYFSLREVLSGTRREGKIDAPCALVAARYGSNTGWQSIYYPAGNMILFNIPVSTNTTYNQHVFNTVTMAPARFKGLRSISWGIYDKNLFFGNSGAVYKFWSGNSDNGANIAGDALTAFTNLGMSGQKLATGQQAIISSEGSVSLSVLTAINYGEPPGVTPIPDSPPSAAAWYSADWYSADWSGGSSIRAEWASANGIGYTFATGLKVTTKNQDIEWFSTNWLFKPVRSI